MEHVHQRNPFSRPDITESSSPNLNNSQAQEIELLSESEEKQVTSSKAEEAIQNIPDPDSEAQLSEQEEQEEEERENQSPFDQFKEGEVHREGASSEGKAEAESV